VRRQRERREEGPPQDQWLKEEAPAVTVGGAGGAS
jgi:hypothetical protein